MYTIFLKVLQQPYYGDEAMDFSRQGLCILCASAWWLVQFAMAHSIKSSWLEDSKHFTVKNRIEVGKAYFYILK